MNWYQLSVKEVFHKLGISESGLTDAEARQRLEEYGPNKLAEEEKISKLKILFH
ncbi:MAG: cation-transporting P-type ATPase, partial [Nitrospirota bacterium]